MDERGRERGEAEQREEEGESDEGREKDMLVLSEQAVMDEEGSAR